MNKDKHKENKKLMLIYKVNNKDNLNQLIMNNNNNRKEKIKVNKIYSNNNKIKVIGMIIINKDKK